MRVDDLFRACKDIPLPGGVKGMVRALSDAEQKEVRQWSLLQSLEVQKELEDEASERYQTSIAQLATIDSPGPFKTIIKEARRLDIERDALTLYPNQFVPMPDGGIDTEQRDALRKREEIEAKVEEARTKHIENRLAEITKKLDSLELDDLRQMALNLAVTVYARRVQYDAIQYASIFYSVHQYNGDGTLERRFESPEQVGDAPGPVVVRLFSEFIEVNSVDPWEIQKNV